MNRLFKPDLVRIVDSFDDKAACLNFLGEMLSSTGCLTFPDRFLAAVKGREEIMSTGIGHGIAIPHARDLTVTCLQIAMVMCKEGLDYQSLDHQPVRLIFMIAVPQSSNQEYMRILRSLSEYLRQDENRSKLLDSKTVKELFEHVHEIEEIILGSLGI